MPLNDNGHNALLTGGLGNVAAYASLHSGDPSTTGTNEITGGSPAYARKAITWNAASTSTRTNNGALAFDVPAATTVSYVGLFSAVTAGTFYGWFPAGAAAPKVGNFDTGDLLTCIGHGFSAGDRITFYPVQAASLPTGLTLATIYYVISSGLTADALKVSTTSGGSAVDVTAAGPVVVQKAVPESFTGQGTYTIADASLVLDARLV